MAKAAPVSHRSAFFDAWREDQHFASTNGGKIHQVITECGGGIQAEAIRGTDQQVRCYPNSFRGQFHTAGYESFLHYDIVGEAPRVAQECVALLDAPVLPSERDDGDHRRPAAGAADPRKHRPRHGARPRAGLGSGLRRDELRQDR